MSAKHFKKYKIHLKTLAGESKMTGKKMQNDFELLGNKVKIVGLKMKAGWQMTMRGMTRVTNLATKAMSLAMSAMGWISMIFMIGAALKSWFDSTKEVDEAQKLLDEQIKTSTDSLTKLNAEQTLIFEKLEETKGAWRSTGDAISYFSNAVNSIPTGSLLETLFKQGDVLDAKWVESIKKTSKNLASLKIGFEELTGTQTQKSLREYFNLLGSRQSMFTQANAAVTGTINAEQKLQGIQKKRTEKALKYTYKDEIDSLMAIVTNETKLAMLRGEKLDTENKYFKILIKILKVEAELARLKQIQANAAWRSKNAYGAQAKDLKAALQAETKRAQILLNTQKQKQAEMNMGNIDKDPIAQARLKMSKLQTQIDNSMLMAEAHILLLGLQLETQVAAAAAAGFESGLSTGLSNLIQGKGSLTDLLVGVGNAMAKAMADAMAKNLASKLTGIVMPEDRRDKIIRTTMEYIQTKQDALNLIATEMHKNIQSTIEDGSAVKNFAEQLESVGEGFLKGLREFFEVNGLMTPKVGPTSIGGKKAFSVSGINAGPHATQESQDSVAEAVAKANETTIQKVEEQKPIDISEMTKLFQGMGGKGEWSWGSIFGLGGKGQFWKNMAGGAAAGGYVTKKGIQGYAGGGKVPGSYSGKDSVPAMLAPGEFVLTPNQMKGVSGSNTVVNVDMGGNVSSQSSDGSEGKALGLAIAGAVNKEIAKQRRIGGTLYTYGPGGI